jgi:AraC-like DNA-binding protein
MASRLSFSPGRFAMLFKRAYQCTPREYLTDLRLGMAARMLEKQRDRPITDIAIELGFSSTLCISEAFRRHRGVSPTRCRAGRRRPS